MQVLLLSFLKGKSGVASRLDCQEQKSRLQGKWVLGEVVWRIKCMPGILGRSLEGACAAFSAAFLLCLLEIRYLDAGRLSAGSGC